MYVYVWGEGLHMRVGAWRGQRQQIPLELEQIPLQLDLPVVVSHPVWVPKLVFWKNLVRSSSLADPSLWLQGRVLLE